MGLVSHSESDLILLLPECSPGLLTQGLVGWLLSIAGVLSIKITSPITHMVSAAVRGILQSLLGVWVFGDIITTLVLSFTLSVDKLTVHF